MATLWALAERTLRAYCLVSTASSPSPSTTSESIYLRTFKAQPANDHRSKTLQIGFGLISLPSPSLDSIRFANLDPPLPGVNDLDLQKKKKKLNRVDSFLVNERIFLSKLIEMDWRWKESLIINDWIGNGGGFGHSRVENRLVRVSSDEAGNDGAAAHCCSYCSFRIHPNWISEKSHSRLPARANNRRLLIINSNRFSFFPPSIHLVVHPFRTIYFIWSKEKTYEAYIIIFDLHDSFSWS